MDDYEKEELSSLKSLVSDVLQKRGVLGKIQAQLRSSVFAVLQESDENGLEASSLKTRAILASPQGRNALYLVRDLLAYLELEYTLSVFDPEIGYVRKHSLTA
ncbi:hypothetical protein BC832DRAFT_129807 [Gaertneriomyces semiglobifer]|nr:hypothetical protein BC832DRAFT_129807 [Gaertneriomyces semiglobifer]